MKRGFTYVTAHSPTLPSLHLRHSSFFNHLVASPTSQFILQPFRCFTYVTAHSPTIRFLHLRHSSFSNPSVASLMSQLILQPFRRFTYVTGTSPTPPGEPPMDPSGGRRASNRSRHERNSNYLHANTELKARIHFDFLNQNALLLLHLIIAITSNHKKN